MKWALSGRCATWLAIASRFEFEGAGRRCRQTDPLAARSPSASGTRQPPAGCHATRPDKGRAATPPRPSPRAAKRRTRRPALSVADRPASRVGAISASLPRQRRPVLRATKARDVACASLGTPADCAAAYERRGELFSGVSVIEPSSGQLQRDSAEPFSLNTAPARTMPSSRGLAYRRRRESAWLYRSTSQSGPQLTEAASSRC
jgi:hypothetical protein